jgi:hypothetical protein
MKKPAELRLEVEELEERVVPGLVGVNPPGQLGPPPPGQITSPPPPGHLG